METTDREPDPALESGRPAGLPRFGPYFAVVAGLLSFGGGLMGAASLLGFSDGACVPCFALAAIVGAIGLAAWALVVFLPARRGQPGAARRGQPGAAAWLGFPVAILAAVGMVPLLLAAAFPQLLGLLGSPDRLQVSRQADELKIEFPRRMREGAINLEINGRPVPPGYFREHPQRAAWRHESRPRPLSLLYLDLEGMRLDLQLDPVRQIAINCVLSAPQMLDEAGARLQPQRLDLPAPPGH